MKKVYLERMGITQWRLRNPGEKNNPVVLALKNTAREVIGVIIADIDASKNREAQEILLTKMAEAITPFAEKTDHFPQKKLSFAIVLGKSSEDFFNQAKIHVEKIIRSHRPIDLIENPLYKKELWENIKSLRELFH
jgi:DNA polymerase III psi subunit